MASFTTRERLIKLYSEHGYISPNPKKIVSKKKKKKIKKKVSLTTKRATSSTISSLGKAITSNNSNLQQNNSTSNTTQSNNNNKKKTIIKKKKKKLSSSNNTKKTATNRLISSISKNKKSSIKNNSTNNNKSDNMLSCLKVTSPASKITPKITAMPSPMERKRGNRNKYNNNSMKKTTTSESKTSNNNNNGSNKPLSSNTKLSPTSSAKTTTRQYHTNKEMIKPKKPKSLPLIRVAIFCAFKSAELKDHPGSLNIKNCLYPTSYDNTSNNRMPKTLLVPNHLIPSYVKNKSKVTNEEKKIKDGNNNNNEIEIKKEEEDITCNDYSPLAIFDVDFINAQSIRTGGLASFDVVIFPGGSSARQAQILNKSGRDAVRMFIASGGGFVGCCAGAFLALSNYCPERSLKIVSAGAILKPTTTNANSPKRQQSLRKSLLSSKKISSSKDGNDTNVKRNNGSQSKINGINKIAQTMGKSKIIECRPNVRRKKMEESRQASSTINNNSTSSTSTTNASSISSVPISPYQDTSLKINDSNNTKAIASSKKKKISRSWEWGHGYVNVKFTDAGRKLLWDEGETWENEKEEIQQNVIRMRYNNGPIMRAHDPPLIGSFCRSLTCLATFDSGIFNKFHDEDNINGNAEQQQAASVAIKTTGGNDENNNKGKPIDTNNDVTSSNITNNGDEKKITEVIVKQQQPQRSTSIINHCAIAYAKPRVPHDRRRTGCVVLISPHPESTTPILSKQNVSNDRYKRLVQRVVMLASGLDPTHEREKKKITRSKSFNNSQQRFSYYRHGKSFY